MKKIHGFILRLIFLFPALGLFTGADYLGQKKIEVAQSIEGNIFRVTIFDAGSRNTTQSLRPVAEGALKTIEETLSTMASQNPDSDVSRINRAKPGESVTLDETTFFVLKESIRVLQSLGEGYDITDAPLKQIWKEARDRAVPPAPEKVQALLPLVDMQSLILDSENHAVQWQRSGPQVNLDEIAVGYALDQAAVYLKSQGVVSAIVATENTAMSIGLSQEGRNWRFGIEHPKKVDGYAAIMEIEQEKVIESLGNYDSFFIYEGKRYPLILDPKTGFPPQNRVASVTVIADNAALAAILSHAFYVMGPEKSFQWIEKFKDEEIEAVFLEEKDNDAVVLSCSEAAQGLLRDIAL